MMNMVQFKGTEELKAALEPLMSADSASPGGTIYSGESLGVIYSALAGSHTVVNYIKAQHIVPSGSPDYWVFYDTDGNNISPVISNGIYGVLFLMNYPSEE